MKALIYVLQRTVINYFKRLKEKPQKAIGPIFFIIWVTFMILPGAKSSSDNAPFEYFVSAFLGIIFLMFLFSLYSGTKTLDSKFDMADVNLIFVSPIKPQTVLLYGIIKKVAVELLTSVYLLYQIPNFLRGYNISVFNQVMLIISFIIFQLVFCNILKLFLFALNTKYNKIGFIIRTFIKGLVLTVVGLLVYLMGNGITLRFIQDAVKEITYNKYVEYIPVFGWIKEMALQTYTGIRPSYYLYLVLLLLISGLLLYITYSIHLDFYEDMLSSAEKNEMFKEIKSGNKKANDYNDGKQSFLFKPFRKVTLKLNRAYGAKVLFFKHMNEYYKRSLVLFINTYSLLFLIASIVLGIFVKSIDIKIIFLASNVLLFFSAGLGGKIYNEINSTFIFLIPDSPQKKLFYGASSSLIKTFTDSLLLFLPFGILNKSSIFEILLCIICYTSLGGMISYSGLFAFRIARFLGFTGMLTQSLFFMFFQLLIIIPAVLIVILFTITFAQFIGGYALYLALLLYSLIGAVIFSFGCVGIFNDMEFMK